MQIYKKFLGLGILILVFMVIAVCGSSKALASTDVTSAVFTTTTANNTVTITLTGGTFKAAPITKTDFTFVGTDATPLSAGTFTRTSNTVVTITGLTGLAGGADNTVTVLAEAQVTQATSVAGLARTFTPATAVNLGTASNFAILSNTGISTTGTTSIIGNIGVGPGVTSTAITGFGLIMDSSNQFSTSSLVNGKAYAHDYTTPTPGNINTASLNMGAAYSDATGRATDVLDAGACVTGTCDLAGTTLTPGVYTFTTPGNVNITNDMYLSGNSSGVWIFQIPGNLDISSAKSIILSGGAQASNIFWAVAGTTTLEAGSTFEGNILAGPSTSTIAMQSGAVLNGRALGQTNVSLIGNTVAIPDLVPVPSSNTTLSNLTISSGTLSPVFTPTTYIYADSVPNSVSSVNVTPTVGEAHATVTVNAIPVTSGSASVSLPLNVGPNTISIVVTAQNASIQQYIIIVNRTPVSNGGSSSSGGGYTTYGCRDPNALNYNAYSTSEPSLCQYATTPTVITPTPTVTTTPTTTSVTSTPTTSQAGYVFTQTLRYGMRNEQVMNLQKILNEDPATQVAKTRNGSPGHETNYFGVATKAAVIKFQTKNGLTADGIVGPKTIKKIKEVAALMANS